MAGKFCFNINILFSVITFWILITNDPSLIRLTGKEKNRSQPSTWQKRISLKKAFVILIFMEKTAESMRYISSNKSICVFFPFFSWLTIKTNTCSLKRLSSHQSLRIFRIEASEEAILMWKQRFAQQFKPLTTQTSPVYTWHNKRHEKQVFIRRGSARTSPKLIYK